MSFPQHGKLNWKPLSAELSSRGLINLRITWQLVPKPGTNNIKMHRILSTKKTLTARSTLLRKFLVPVTYFSLFLQYQLTAKVIWCHFFEGGRTQKYRLNPNSSRDRQKTDVVARETCNKNYSRKNQREAQEEPDVASNPAMPRWRWSVDWRTQIWDWPGWGWSSDW